MKTSWTARVTLGVLASFISISSVTGATPATTPYADVANVSVASQGELEFRFNAIKIEVAGDKYEAIQMIRQIDGLVKQIDQAIANRSGDMLDLIKLRNETLRLRDQVAEVAHNNGVKLIQALPAGHTHSAVAHDANLTGNAVQENVLSDTLIDERVVGESILSPTGSGTPFSGGTAYSGGSFGAGTYSGGTFRSAGFSGGGMGGGFGGGGGFAGGGPRIGLLGAGIAAAIAIPIATSNDDDDSNGGVGSIVSSDD